MLFPDSKRLTTPLNFPAPLGSSMLAIREELLAEKREYHYRWKRVMDWRRGQPAPMVAPSVQVSVQGIELISSYPLP